MLSIALSAWHCQPRGWSLSPWCRKSPNSNDHIQPSYGTRGLLFQFFPPWQWAQGQQSLNPLVGSRHHFLPKGHLLLCGVHPVHRDAIAQTWKEQENCDVRSCKKNSYSMHKILSTGASSADFLSTSCTLTTPRSSANCPHCTPECKWQCKSHKMQEP